MNAKILKNLLMIFVLMVISSGCAEKIYVDRIVEVKVPQIVDIPEIKCYPGKETYTEEIKEMRLCIERYKEIISSYSEKGIDNEK